MNLEQAFSDLSGALRRLHKTLIDAEVENYGPVNGPYQLLHLVAYEPHFAWLHCLSELMVDLDKLRTDIESAEADQIAGIRKTIEQLVGPRAPMLPQFRDRYVVLLQQAPEVAMAHGEVQRVLNRFPESSVVEQRRSNQP